MKLKDLLIPCLVAAPFIVVGSLYLLWRKPEGERYSLTTEATVGGTVNGSYPPSTYVFDEPTGATLTASPLPGYIFRGWWLDGEYQHDDLMFSLTVSANHLLIASFEEEGAPPLFPAYIRPIQNCDAEDWWYTFKEKSGIGETLYLQHEFYKDGFAKFKICDAAGNGVPLQQIAVYTDPQPDITDFGTVMLADAIHLIDNPLILQSDNEGVVSVKTRYSWLEPDSNFKNTIGYGGKVHWVCLKGIYEGDSYPIANGDHVTFPCYFESFTRIRHPVIGPTLNAIHAYWVDNPNLPVWGDCYATCMIKIEPSKNY